jgi:hypothetical protein
LVEIEELRVPGHGRRRRWRETDHVVVDQRLVAWEEPRQLRSASDLLCLLPAPVPAKFHTGELAALAGVSRSFAQKIAYCLRQMGAIDTIGKQGNALLYQARSARKKRKRKAA